MKTASINVLVLFAACLGTIGLRAQAPQTPQDSKSSPPRGQQPGQAQLHVPPEAQHMHSSTYKYLVSDEGRAWMQVSGRPISKSLNERFGPPSPAAVEQARARLLRMAAQPQAVETESDEKSAPCNGSAGARFNLEPRANAEPQNEPVADFILNGVGQGEDLIVQAANDWRGEYPNKKWNDSISGYYVHSSKTADCSVQFEGGLPDIGQTFGFGEGAVAADPVRRAVFMADGRYPAGIGLFRATTANLLNPKICPPGTHLEAQAESCWGQTPPVLLGPNGTFPGLGNVVVDERATGTGAGDVYVLWNDTYEYLVACTNSLAQCSSPLNVGGKGNIISAGAYIQVRTDGLITISYEISQYVNESILFVTCTSAGAPNPPVCQQPTTAATIAHPIPTAEFPNQILQNITNAGMVTYPKHVNRQENNGGFTTFLVYDDCKNPYTPPPPPNDPPTLCLSAEVNMTLSTDNGQTWSNPVSVNVANAHQFYPSIALDASTGTVSIAWYSTEGDRFFHDIRVFMAQIAPGSTALGPAKPVTTFSPIDTDPGPETFYLGDANMGAIAHGTGKAGQSHLYLSFDSAAVNGTYNKKPLPELNNHIKLITY
jgi:hypothetical protein